MAGAEIIHKYFPGLSPLQAGRFDRLHGLYREWNAKINVISRKDIDLFYERHVLHSLGIARIIQFRPGTRIMDIGTGGGFPGIPLAILFPGAEFLLTDSIGKKIRVVQEIAAALELNNVRAVQTRAEEVKERFDFIVSRAVTAFPEFYKWVKGKVSAQSSNALPNGILYLKGGDLREELGQFPKARIYDLKDFFSEDFFETKKVVYLQV